MKLISTFTLLLSSWTLLGLADLSFAGGWDNFNNPFTIIGKSGESAVTNIHQLKKSARLKKVSWPDTYWPRNKYGIAWRFQEDKHNPLYVLRNGSRVDKGFTKDELLRMTVEQLNCLSPAEKIDVANCDYSYSLMNRELKAHSPHDSAWEGYCHGWGPAAGEYEEPQKCRYTNRDGIAVDFTSSDIKGGLIFNWANNNGNPATMCGKRMGGSAGIRRFFGIEDKDINAGAFHLLMTNMIGEQGKWFVFDIDPNKQVWNQPFYGYDIVSMAPISGEISDEAAPGTVREYAVEADILYINEIDGPSPEPEVGGPRDKVNTDSDHVENGFIIKKRYQYVLETDAEGNILGGHWEGKSKRDHPDDVWTQDAPAFNGNMKVLEKIYKTSIQK